MLPTAHRAAKAQQNHTAGFNSLASNDLVVPSLILWHCQRRTNRTTPTGIPLKQTAGIFSQGIPYIKTSVFRLHPSIFSMWTAISLATEEEQEERNRCFSQSLYVISVKRSKQIQQILLTVIIKFKKKVKKILPFFLYLLKRTKEEKRGN